MKFLKSFLIFALLPFAATADCTLTNLDLTPLTDMGLNFYKGFSGGLYPNGVNNRPPAHLEAATDIAINQIKLLDANGNVNTNNGKIVLLSIGMSNTTQEWASGSNDGGGNSYTFKTRANADPSKNPRVFIVDGAQGGQDVTRWTNLTATTWTNVLTRLNNSGVTTNQVQAVWIKQSLQNITQYGGFPEAVQKLQGDLEILVRNLKVLCPNLQLAYISSRTRCYKTNNAATNPEPYSWEVGLATKWMIERQINGAPDLNFDPAKGSVIAPLLSWGPYLWADGAMPRSDDFTYLCQDVVQTDFTHPSSSGVQKVATQLLSFFKTDPTATPWFLRTNVTGEPPECAISASVTNGIAPLTVNFTASASDPDGTIRDYQWTFDDGTFSTNADASKTFYTPGVYTARLTVTDSSGNAVMRSVPITVNTTIAAWKNAKFTPAELADANISGDSANPDGDQLPNLLEYALGLEPKSADADVPRFQIAGDEFEISFPRFKAATDVLVTLEVSSDFSAWDPVTSSETRDDGAVSTLIWRETLPANSPRFFRIKSAR